MKTRISRHCAAAGPCCEPLERRWLLTVAYPTADEQYMIEVINRARANPQAEVALWSSRVWGDTQMPSDPQAPYFPVPQAPSLNEGLPAGTITPDAKQPLALNPILESTSQEHSQYMVSNDIFSHYEGSLSPFDRMNNAGYSGFVAAGENIAAQTTNGQSVADTLLQEEGNLFVDNNESSSEASGQRGHRQNLMNPVFKEIGVGAVEGLFSYPGDPNMEDSVLVTEDFGTRPGNSFLTGVAYNDLNKNNFYDPGEGLGGVTITATNTSTNQAFSTTTWAAGGYSLQLAPGTYTVTASGGGIGAPTPVTITIGSLNIQQDFNPVPIADHLLSTTIGDGTAQRSEVRKVTFTFDNLVNFASGAVTLFLLNSGGSGANNGSAPTNVSSSLASPTSPDGGRTWVVTFKPNTTYTDSTGSLADGIYTITLHGALVTDVISGAGLGADSSTTFHRLFGDITGSKTVNNGDYLKFKAAYLSATGNAKFNANFDYDGNGQINNADFLQFKKRYLKVFAY